MRCSEDFDFQLAFLLSLEHLAGCPSSWAKMWPPKNFFGLQLQNLKILAFSCRKVLSRHSPVASNAWLLWIWGFQGVMTTFVLLSSWPCSHSDIKRRSNEWNLRLVVLWLRLAANVFSPRPEGLTYRDEHFLHSRTPQVKISRKRFIRMKYFFNGKIRFSFNIWKEELNIMTKQTLPEGQGWSK